MSTLSDKETELFLDELEKSNGSGINFKDLMYLCLAKWYWFVISLVLLLGFTSLHLLTTPPVYTRSASLLIKEDSKGNSLSNSAGVLGDLDLFQTNTNVNNEMQSLQSPAVMYDVVNFLYTSR